MADSTTRTGHGDDEYGDESQDWVVGMLRGAGAGFRSADASLAQPRPGLFAPSVDAALLRFHTAAEGATTAWAGYAEDLAAAADRERGGDGEEAEPS